MKFLLEIIELIDQSIDEDAPTTILEGSIIKESYNEEIDSYRSCISQAHKWISTYQMELSEGYGKSIKIKYTANLGYFIETPKSLELGDEQAFIHKQSLSTAHRYSSKQLAEFEENIHQAQTKLSEKEYEVFQSIRDSVSTYYEDLHNLSGNIAFLDFLSNGAYISKLRGYSQVEFVDDRVFEVSNGKHPVLAETQQDFISNSLSLSQKEYLHIITGPNMGGKSTFLRQNALLLIMAHMGYDIPASSCKTGCIDKIFSRVGASDNLYLGQSTFMVEMQEMSFILANATQNSFIIIDEVGRGTSTSDGMSLAWGILKYIHDALGAMCLFATHYHELIDYSQSLKGVQNFSVAVGEEGESLIFLRKIIPGGMRKSYGIHVAQIAGLHKDVLSSACSLLEEIEQTRETFTPLQMNLGNIMENSRSQETDELIEEIQNLKLESMTPLESINHLHQLKELVKKIK